MLFHEILVMYKIRDDNELNEDTLESMLNFGFAMIFFYLLFLISCLLILL